MTLAMVNDAVAGGARLEASCERLGVSARTVQRWRKFAEDRRCGPQMKRRRLDDSRLENSDQRDRLNLISSAHC